MTTYWQVALSAAGGVVAALTGVSVGAVLTARNLRTQWARSAQLDAVTKALAEYAYIYQKFYEWQRDGAKPQIDWVGWNNALANLSVTADPRVFDAAEAIDALFWTSSNDLLSREVDWSTLRHRLESAHIGFVNVCRHRLVGSTGTVRSVIAAGGRSVYESRLAPGQRTPAPPAGASHEEAADPAPAPRSTPEAD